MDGFRPPVRYHCAGPHAGNAPPSGPVEEARLLPANERTPPPPSPAPLLGADDAARLLVLLLGVDDVRFASTRIVFVTESWLRSMPLVELLIFPWPAHSPVMSLVLAHGLLTQHGGSMDFRHRAGQGTGRRDF